MIWIWLLLSYIVMEVLVNLTFSMVFRLLHTSEEHQTTIRKRSLVKGIIERLFLITGMLYGYPHVIIAFGALKIGTRFQSSRKVSNDYFLIGNFISLLFAMIFVIAVKKLLIG